MDNNLHLPEGWAMPPEMAKRVNEFINKKPITPEDNLQIALDEMARDIALIEPNPVDWGGWVIYLFEKMEAEAERRFDRDEFTEVLKSLNDGIVVRVKVGRW